MFKFLVWHVLFAAGTCELFKEESGYVVQYAPNYVNYKPRDYHFDYAVSDPHTGDHKSQWEVKTNGVVRGGYSLLEPDGTTRIVEYIADHDGFRAVVNKVGTAIHPEVVPQLHVPEVVQPLPEVVQPLPVVSHHSAYDGHVANYAPPVEVPSFGVQVPPVLYRIEQTIGSGEGLITQPQALGTVEISGGNNLAVPLEVPQQYAGGFTQGHEISQVPNLANIERRIDVVPAQGYESGIPGVPLSQEANIGGAINSGLERIEGLQQGYNLGSADAVPLQRYGLGRIDVGPVLQGQNLGKIEDNLRRFDALHQELQGYGLASPEVVPAIQSQNLGRIDAGLDEIGIQGQNLGHIDVALGGAEGVPLPQGHDIGRIDADLRVPVEVNNFEGARLPQPQIEIYKSRPIPQLDQGRNEGAAVPGLVPVSPSYTTNIQYEGLTDDNGLRKDLYHASYSEKVLKVVPSPRKHQKKARKEFLIYYPDSESH